MESVPNGIRMGFYWHALPEAEACRRLLNRFFPATLFSIVPEFFPAMSGAASVLSLGTIEMLMANAPKEWNWQNQLIEQACASNDSFPARVKLEYRYVGADFVGILEGRAGYAPTLPDGRGERRVIEIQVDSRMQFKTVPGMQPIPDPFSSSFSFGPDLAPEKQYAILVKFLVESVFEPLCQELSPDYAAFREDWELLPPSALVRSRDWRDFNDLYLWREANVAFDRIGRELSRLKLWTARNFANGLFIELRDDIPWNQEQCNQGMEILRDFFRRRF